MAQRSILGVASSPQPDVTERLDAQTPETGAMDKQPAVTLGTISACVAALIALLIVFGVDISAAQTETTLGFLVAAAPIATAVWIRRKVYAPRTVRTLANQAEQDGRDQIRASRPPGPPGPPRMPSREWG